MERAKKRWAVIALVALAGCRSPAPAPAPMQTDRAVPPPVATVTPFPERVKGVGTEPFWAIELDGARLTYSRAGEPDRTAVGIVRRAEGGSLRFSGTLAGGALSGLIAPGSCSDGMSDRTYPYALTLRFGAEELRGCAYPADMVFAPS